MYSLWMNRLEDFATARFNARNHPTSGPKSAIRRLARVPGYYPVAVATIVGGMYYWPILPVTGFFTHTWAGMAALGVVTGARAVRRAVTGETAESHSRTDIPAITRGQQQALDDAAAGRTTDRSVDITWTGGPSLENVAPMLGRDAATNVELRSRYKAGREGARGELNANFDWKLVDSIPASMLADRETPTIGL